MVLEENLVKIRENIAKAFAKADRKPEDIALVAATKQATAGQVRECIKLGIKDIAENRVFEAEEKFNALSDLKFKKHMIGHLQTNKAKAAISVFDVMQSLDSLKLAKEIDKRAKNTGKIMPVFIEVNIGKEEQKSGVLPEETLAFYDKIIKFSNLKVNGLMCIAPLVEPEQARPYFKQMKKLSDQLKLKWLSMGMSNDYIIAIEEGSNMVRIGRALFGY